MPGISTLIVRFLGVILFSYLFATITANGQHAGEIDLSFNPSDTGFGFGDGPVLGNSVNSTLLSDDRILIWGDFKGYNGVELGRIARLHADGALDNSFDSGVGANGEIKAVALQSDNKIIIGGWFYEYNGTPQFCLARLHPNAELDTSFQVDIDGSIKAIAIQADGKIIVGGLFSNCNGQSRNSVARLNPDGSLDTSFASGLDGHQSVYTINIQADGKIIICGNFTAYDGVSKYKIARLNADGSIDNNFTANGTDGTITSVVIQPDEGILVAGYFDNFNGATIHSLVRLLPDGTTDLSFNPGETMVGYATSIRLQQEGKIVIGGDITQINGQSLNGSARLHPDGSLDTSFEADRTQEMLVNSVGIQSTGKIIICGSFSEYSGGNRILINRLTSNGTLDATFNPNTGADYAVSSIITQPDGKIWLTGSFTRYNGRFCNRIARINPDGTIDDDFNPGLGGNNSVNASILQEDGKLLILGEFSEIHGIARNKIARLNSDGSLDMGFDPGSDSWFSNHGSHLRFLKPLPDGKILTGTRRVFRLNDDGTLDNSFTSNVELYNDIRAAAFQPDGKILLSGIELNGQGIMEYRILRLNPDGTRDTKFDLKTGAASSHINQILG